MDTGVLELSSKIFMFSFHKNHNKDRLTILQRALPLIEFLKHLKKITIISQILHDGIHTILASKIKSYTTFPK